MRIFLLILLVLASISSHAFTVNKDEKLFNRGVKQLEIGSYSTAIDYFVKLLKPDSKYYKDSLFMLAKTYLAIGKKTGQKKYLWQALNYLQLYFISLGNRELPWKYYYIKAKIYENLGFYEQALAIYRVAFLKAKNERERIETTVGIIRTAVWVRRPDIVDEYFILISSAKLTPKEKREVEFVKGLVLFSQEKYKKALPFFFKVYRKYENYLIDNPEYYYYVAENIYRVGNLKLAEQLFRRIVSLTKSPTVRRKSILRLGDIELNKKNTALAFVYYYSVIDDNPDSQEAQVARLKIIPLLDIPEIRYRANLSEDKSFKDPVKYVARTLVINRTNYVGIYALADLGYLVFKLGNRENVFKRLVWEVSLIFPEQVKFEQREYLRKLWKPFILKLPSDKGCRLYRANPRLFKELFGREALFKFAQDLKHCNMRKLRLSLLRFMLKKWHSDREKLLLAQALFDNKDFRDALAILESVKNKNTCSFVKLLLKIGIFLEQPTFNNNLNEICMKEIDEEVAALNIYYYSRNGKLDDALDWFRTYREKILESYSKNVVVKAAVNTLLESAMVRGRYREVYDTAKLLAKKGYLNCLTGSYLVIASVRTGNIKEARDFIKELKLCKDNFSKLARNIYDDALMSEVVRNEPTF